jgi:hypothetical protein
MEIRLYMPWSSCSLGYHNVILALFLKEKEVIPVKEKDFVRTAEEIEISSLENF